MTIREFARTIWAGKYYVLIAVLVVVAGAFVYLKGTTTTYEATAEVTLESGSVPGSEGDGGPTAVTVSTDPTLVRESDVVAAAAKDLGNGETEESLAPRITANYNSDNQVMYITAQAEDPAVAVDRANAMAQAYSTSLVAVLQKQVTAYDQRLADLDAQLQGTHSTANGNDPDGPIALANRNAIEDQITETSSQRVALTAIDPPAEVSLPATGATALGLSSTIVLAIAILVGLVAGIGLAFARRGLDTRVGASPEAANLAGSPVLAELYSVKSAEKDYARTGVLPVSSRTASPFTESIRELRTAVQVPIGEGGYAVVAVTAADPHAPRAFITANLAASFALSGRPTVVVPGDLRQPQLAAILPPPPGWHGGTDTLRPTRIPNLSILPVHDEELDPADFLATAAVREMIAAQRANAAVVVIDSPPVLAAADATILGGYAQGVVLVASAGKTNRAVLQEAAERLRTNNVPLVGVALTGLEGDRRMLYASTYGQAGEVTVAAPEAAPEAPAASGTAPVPARPGPGAPAPEPAAPADESPAPGRPAARPGPDGSRARLADAFDTTARRPLPDFSVEGPGLLDPPEGLDGEPLLPVSGPVPLAGAGRSTILYHDPGADATLDTAPGDTLTDVDGAPIGDPEDTQTRAIPVVEPAAISGSSPRGGRAPANSGAPRLQRPIRPPSAGPARRR